MSIVRSQTMSTPSSRPSARLRKEPSPDREKSTQALIAEIRKELDAVMKMKRQDKPGKAYACYQDIEKIWKKKRIAALISPSSPSDAQIEFIQKHMIIILSTLVWIAAAKCLRQFRSRFFEPISSSEAKFTDHNVPCFKKGELGFLDPEPALKEQFYDEQFRFCPAKIKTYEDRQTTLEIDPNQRLPFERIEKRVGSGGFGKVDMVVISPRYYYQYGSGPRMVNDKAYVVACKKIKLKEDFDKEKGNLQILKESLTKHVRIMLHLTTIEHGLHRYILLPYARHGDLEVFLHGGFASGNEKRYEFDEVFRLDQSDMIIPLFAECVVLADALKWLHNQITIDHTSDTVFCAHMDLKPANILILPDSKSPVGKWMISDFGISVFKEETQQHDPEYGSIGDYISQVTMNTRPKRQEGTYQAPEVTVAKKIFNQTSHLTPDQRGIGRKSDVWSFGCILSEILAFSQGKAKLVQEFTTARKRNARDDYFYVERPSRYLTAADGSSELEYEVRPTVFSWLEDLCEKSTNPHKWMHCYVGTIKEILIVDPSERPSAAKLHEFLQHVQYHIRHYRDAQPPKCHILNPREIPVVSLALGQIDSPTPSLSDQSEITQVASIEAVLPTIGTINEDPEIRIFRRDTAGAELIHGVQVDTSPALQPHIEILEKVEEIELEGTIPNNTDTLDIAQADNPVPTADDEPLGPAPTPADLEPARPEPYPIQCPDDPLPDSHHRSSLFRSFARPAHAHGIKIDTSPQRTVQPSICKDLPLPGKKLVITAIAMTRHNEGAQVACLSKSSVFLFTLKTKDLSATFDSKIEVCPSSEKWTGVAVAGDFLVAWGHDSRKLIYFCNTKTQEARFFGDNETAMLTKAAVSPQGVVALVCRRNIRIATVDSSRDTITLSCLASEHQNFTHAAFNDTGDLLFAWAYGQTDRLYCWRVQDGVLEPTTESESPYETVKIGKPDEIKVIPYNSYQGCIVERPDKNLFPAQIRSTLRENKKPFSRNDTQISKLQAACMFNDYSLITIECSGLFGSDSHLKEYKINYSGTHVLVTPGVEIGDKLKSNTKSTSQILAVKDGSEIVIIICNKDATVEFVKVLPGRSMTTR